MIVSVDHAAHHPSPLGLGGVVRAGLGLKAPVPIRLYQVTDGHVDPLCHDIEDGGEDAFDDITIQAIVVAPERTKVRQPAQIDVGYLNALQVPPSK